MKLKEAMEKGIKKIKLPEWNKEAYLEIQYSDIGLAMPVLILHDVGNSSEPVMFYEVPTEGWIEYE